MRDPQALKNALVTTSLALTNGKPHCSAPARFASASRAASSLNATHFAFLPIPNTDGSMLHRNMHPASVESIHFNASRPHASRMSSGNDALARVASSAAALAPGLSIFRTS